MDWMSWKTWTIIGLIIVALFAIYAFAATQSARTPDVVPPSRATRPDSSATDGSVTSRRDSVASGPRASAGRLRRVPLFGVDAFAAFFFAGISGA